MPLPPTAMMKGPARRAVLQFIRPIATPCRYARLRFTVRLTPQPRLIRNFATPPPMLNASTMSMSTYENVSDATMDSLLEALEEIVDSLNDPRFEVEYSSGVLTLSLGDDGTYVINKQPPNKQIWLSSPLSGPKRYDYSEANNAWFYSRDGKTLGALLNEELGAALGKPVDLGML